MSQFAPGWYPDASGRCAERYYDGERWTADVRDQHGRAGSDPVPGVTADRVAIPNRSATVGAPRAPSTSSFQFGPAPTHATAYAAESSGGSDAPPESSGRRLHVAVPPVRLLLAAGGVVAIALTVLALGLWR